MIHFSKNTKLIGIAIALCFLFLKTSAQFSVLSYSTVTTGAEQLHIYLPKLKNKRVAIITNVTGKINNTTIVDTLLSLKVNVLKIFGPEHGFRGDTEAGDKVATGIDAKTKLPVISLYGANKKPNKEQLKDVDIVVYDIQDIGVRFYTYISTMCYVMEACAENKKEMLVLDRPNPNGFYIDGPVLKNEFKGFLGLHNVPLVYGLTCGEYANMVNAEGWLKNKIKCKLTVVPLKNYNRNFSYDLPHKPSPNIGNSTAVLLYPSLGLFEGTIVSLGRGTNFPFEVIGHPKYSDTTFKFIPIASSLSKTPKYLNTTCYGIDLRKENYTTNHPKQLNLQWIQQMYLNLKQEDFFDKNFNYHSGNIELQQQLKSKISIEEIRKTWAKDIATYKLIRKKYLLYKDFE